MVGCIGSITLNILADKPSSYQAVVAEYRSRAADYDREWSGYIAATVARTLDALHPAPGARVLDVGCGTGVLLQRLAERFESLELAGIDPVVEMLEVGRKRLPKTVFLQQGRAEGLPFADNSFDLVVSSSIFHYLEQPLTALREMHRVLRPGGRAVITDWCRDYLSVLLCGWYLRLSGQPFYRIYRQRELCRLLSRAGFDGIGHERYKIDWLWGMMTVLASR